MKKYLEITPILLFCIGILFSCKKDSTPAPKDYNASIKDKTWSGAITYTGKITEYYGVYFKADNTLEWVELSGTYTGHWTINGKELTLSFDGSASKITADISDDDKLVNIVDNTGAWEINSGAMITNPGLPLDNTVWKGTWTNTLSGTTQACQISFMTGGTVEIKIGNTVIGTPGYTRKASGAAIRSSKGFFGVLMSTGEMRGSDTHIDFPWQVIKQ